MGRISQQTIEFIRSKADIVEVVGQYVQLKKAGRNYKGLCPFHDEKTPSFVVSEQKQIYHCFGCHEGGGVINFIMAIENMEFVEAVKFLGEKYGVEIESGDSGKPKELLAQLSEMHELAAKQYAANLDTPDGKKVVEYYRDRGLDQRTVSYFQLGYSGKQETAILELLRSKNFSSQAMQESGLIISTDRGYKDRFVSRTMFPIRDTRKHLVAFAGRVFDSDHPAKYMNSPDTPLYNKSRILYGLWASREAVRKQDQVIVVEGYLDYLQLYQAGIQNLAAVSGTGFTDQHASEIRKYSRNVVLAYDGDSAGIKAAVRAGFVLLQQGLEPKIIVLPEGLDPDDWVKRDGPEPFLESAASAKGLLRFQFEKFGTKLESTSDKAQYLNQVLQELAGISDQVTRELYLRDFADITGVKEQTLYNALQDILNRARQRRPKPGQANGQEVKLATRLSDGHSTLEDELLQLCFVPDINVRMMLYDHLDPDWLRSQVTRRIYEKVYIHLHSNVQPDSGVVLDGLEFPEDRRRLSALVLDVDKILADRDMAVECLVRLEQKYIQRELETHREQLKQAGTDPEQMKQLVGRISELQQQQQAVHSKYQ